MSFEPRNGESSVAGAFRESFGRNSMRALQQRPISSFTSIQTTNSQSLELIPTLGRQPQTTGGQFIDLVDHESSVEHSFDFETPASHQGQPRGGEELYAANDLEEQLTSDGTHAFEFSKTHFFYEEALHQQWVTWWEKTPGFRAYREKYGGKKQIHWNSTARGAEIWKYYRQCAIKSGENLGRPHIQCVLCSGILVHPASSGTTSMHEHHKSQTCKKIRQKNVMEDESSPTLEELWKRGTKVRNLFGSLNSSSC